MTSKLEEDNPLLKMLRKHGYKPPQMAGVVITEPITEANFKEFQDKLRAMVPPKLLEEWDKEDLDEIKAK